MFRGRIVEDKDADGLFRAPQHPYTRALLDSVLAPGLGRRVPDAQPGIAFPNPLDPPVGCTFHPRCSSALPGCNAVDPFPVRQADGYVERHLYDRPACEGAPA